MSAPAAPAATAWQVHEKLGDCDVRCDFWTMFTVRAENNSELIPQARKIEFESCK